MLLDQLLFGRLLVSSSACHQYENHLMFTCVHKVGRLRDDDQSISHLMRASQANQPDAAIKVYLGCLHCMLSVKTTNCQFVIF